MALVIGIASSFRACLDISTSCQLQTNKLYTDAFLYHTTNNVINVHSHFGLCLSFVFPLIFWHTCFLRVGAWSATILVILQWRTFFPLLMYISMYKIIVMFYNFLNHPQMLPQWNMQQSNIDLHLYLQGNT